MLSARIYLKRFKDKFEDAKGKKSIGWNESHYGIEVYLM